MPVPLIARPSCRLLLAGLALASTAAGAQTIQRCEAADGRISYSDAACPAGTRAMKTVAPASAPSEQARQEALARAQREREVAQQIGANRQPVQSSARAGQATVTVEEARRAADCAYLRAELESNRRLRNLLTTRPYYSLDDVEQMDARDAGLAADYRRFCTR